MHHRIVTCIVIGMALSTAVVVDGQKYSVPRMPDGRPDMQGVWANNNMTPLQRPPQFAGRATMTDAELADLKQKAKALMDGGDAFFADELVLAALDGKTKFSSGDTQTGNYDQSWLSERIFDNRTSLIVDPPDGRLPPLTPGAAERADGSRVDLHQLFEQPLADRVYIGAQSGQICSQLPEYWYLRLVEGAEVDDPIHRASSNERDGEEPAMIAPVG